MRRCFPTELDSLKRLGLLDLYAHHHLMFDFLERESWDELRSVGVVRPLDEDVLDALKVKIVHNRRFNVHLTKRLHSRPEYYENYAEMLARFIIAKNGNKSYNP